MIKSFGPGAALILACSIAAVGPVQAQGINIESGTIQGGALETRNDPIRIGDEVVINGRVGSRNGSITIGNQVSAEQVTTRNGSISIGQGGQFGDISTRNGSVRIGPGNQFGEVDSRNGQVNIGSESVSKSLSNRNGSITIGQGSTVNGNADTRNGALKLESGVRVTGDTTTRNGRISLAPGVEVSGKAVTRNGNIELDNAVVVEGLESMTGDLILNNASRVDGDLVIEMDENAASGGRFLWFSRRSEYPDAGNIRILGNSEVGGNVVVILPADYDGEPPVVEIEAGSTVHGDIRVDERVELITNGTVGGRIE